MKVSLIDYSADALNQLLFTKQTRLTMNASLLDEIRAWPMEKKLKELDYMRHTIQSSWEFTNYTFAITGVSRAFTHQFVRTRSGAYAQQSQRTVDMEGFHFVTPRELSKLDEDSPQVSTYNQVMSDINVDYAALRDLGVSPQDARGVLPTNICTNIVGRFSLRTLADMAKLRLCTRTQGEYQDIFRKMREEVIKVHPYFEPFIRVHCAVTGICAFKNYEECPIKPPTFNPDTGLRWDEKPERPATREEIQVVWERTKFEATPKSHEDRQ